MTLSSDEVLRYARHLVLPEIGGPGQQRLKDARILLVGAGGIGSPAALYLAAAGVGTIGLADDDTVSLSNLQRQILFGDDDVGRLKVEAGAARLASLNSEVAVRTHAVRVTGENGADLVAGYDLVLDGSDSFETRSLVADLCESARRPLVSAAVQRFSGALTVLTPYAPRPDGTLWPRWRDLHPQAPPADLLPACAETGVLGALTGVLGTLAAAEAIKLVCGFGEPLLGRLLMVDALAMRFDEIAYRRRPERPSPST